MDQVNGPIERWEGWEASTRWPSHDTAARAKRRATAAASTRHRPSGRAHLEEHPLRVAAAEYQQLPRPQQHRAVVRPRRRHRAARLDLHPLLPGDRVEPQPVVGAVGRAAAEADEGAAAVVGEGVPAPRAGALPARLQLDPLARRRGRRPAGRAAAAARPARGAAAGGAAHAARVIRVRRVLLRVRGVGVRGGARGALVLRVAVAAAVAAELRRGHARRRRRPRRPRRRRDQQVQVVEQPLALPAKEEDPDAVDGGERVARAAGRRRAGRRGERPRHRVGVQRIQLAKELAPLLPAKEPQAPPGGRHGRRVQLARPVARRGGARLQRAPRHQVGVQDGEVIQDHLVDAAVDEEEGADGGGRMGPPVRREVGWSRVSEHAAADGAKGGGATSRIVELLPCIVHSRVLQRKAGGNSAPLLLDGCSVHQLQQQAAHTWAPPARTSARPHAPLCLCYCIPLLPPRPLSSSPRHWNGSTGLGKGEEHCLLGLWGAAMLQRPLLHRSLHTRWWGYPRRYS